MKYSFRFSSNYFASILLVLCLAAVHANASEKITLAQNLSPISGVTIVAKAQGFFEKEGLDVEVRNLTSGKLALDAVLGGAADFGTVAETPLMRAGLANQPVAIIATMESSDNDVKLIVRTDRGINSIKDLKGKKIATFVGTSAQFFLVKALETQGLTSTDLSLLNLRPEDMSTALYRGDIDGYAIWEPNVYKGKTLLGAKAKIIPTKDIYVETFNIAVMKQYLKKNPDVVHHFLKAILDAEAYIKAHPVEAGALISKATGMDVKLFSEIRPDFHYRVALEPSLLQYINEEAQWDISTGKAKPGSDYKSLLKEMIVADPLRSLAPDRIVGY